jgi:hypothetical protein
VTDFKETEMRKMCRKCRSKLPTPTSNEREGFCCRGCYNAFYRKHCRVCEAEIEQPKRGERILCKRPKCRTLWDAKSGFGRYAPFGAESISEVPANQAVLSAPKPVGWRIIAGPALTPSQLHCATVPDGPDCQWQDGKSYERTEAQNRRLLDKDIASKQPEPIDSSIWNMCAACGREDDLVDHKVTLDGGITLCCDCRAKWILSRQIEKLEREAQYADAMAEIPADLSIPPFLDRRPKPLAMAA